ncbi:MAG: KH domain-containing protein [Acidobacteria bacterium]|nr:KH domain-containing protein [Acidobacteriota bacterium]
MNRKRPSRSRSHSETDLHELVEHLAKSLVDLPEEVRVEEQSSAGTSVLELHIASSDIGKIIGKHGKTARALRTVLNAAAEKQSIRCALEIAEEGPSRHEPSTN